MGDFPVPETPSGWLTITQAGAHFGVSRSTVLRCIAAGEWPTPLYLPGLATRRFSPEQLDAIAALAVPASV